MRLWVHHLERAALAFALALPVGAGRTAAAAGECWTDVDQTTVDRLRLFTYAGNVTAGETVSFQVGVHTDGDDEGYYYIPACVAWSVSPPELAAIVQYPEYPEKGGAPGSADPQGLLVIAAGAPVGAEVVLTGDVLDGRGVLEARYRVYQPDRGPLVGWWHETGQLRCPHFMNGDVDMGGTLEITDAIRLFNHLFLGDGPSPCFDAADSNRDGEVDISDGLFILGHLFRGTYRNGAFPECRPHALGSRLSCDRAGGCGVAEGDLLSPVEIPIEYLFLGPDLSFRVAWADDSWYAGTYSYDLAAQTVSFEILNGNHRPRDAQVARGSFAIEEGGLSDQLRLEHLWFGTPRDDEVEIACGHRFVRWR